MSHRNNVLNSLLIKSAHLESELNSLFELAQSNPTSRMSASRVMCGVSFEHAESVKLLIVAGNFTSAVCLLRLQYESLVRAIWILFAASEQAVEKLQSQLNHENIVLAEKLPMLSSMLTELEGKGPPEVAAQLLEFKEYSWKHLSSYVHGGIHAMSRHSKGYPDALLVQAIKASNGLSLMAGMLAVIVSGQPGQSGRVSRIQSEHSECLPPHRSAGS